MTTTTPANGQCRCPAYGISRDGIAWHYYVDHELGCVVGYLEAAAEPDHVEVLRSPSTSDAPAHA